ncbi:MAG: hypothetical protein ACJATF_004339 [Flavobacteriales bacterium]|jgi:hypothetical protein
MNVLVPFGKITKSLACVFTMLAIASTTVSAGVVYAVPMTVEEADMGNVITWSTATEQTSDYFAVFKSTDGIEFEQIGEEAAMGDSNVKKDYRFLDSSIGFTKAFYRLLQVDVDGEQSYTHISVVDKENPNNFMITMMGNTTTDRYFNVVFKSEETGHMSYRLINLNKEVVKRGVINIDEGQNLFTLDLENAASGRYNFEFNMKEEKEILTLVKSTEDVMVNNKK